MCRKKHTFSIDTYMQVGIRLFLQNLINFSILKMERVLSDLGIICCVVGKMFRITCLCFFLSFVFCSLRVFRRCIEINLTLQHSCSVSRSERLALSDKRKCRNRAAAPGLGAMLPPLSLSLSLCFSWKLQLNYSSQFSAVFSQSGWYCCCSDFMSASLFCLCNTASQTE